MMKSGSFEPIIDILIESSARNSLLNSAVLEMLQYIYKVHGGIRCIADGRRAKSPS